MTADVSKLLSLDNPVFKAYLFYSTILGLKILSVVFLIGRQRFTKKIFISPEDLRGKSAKVKTDDPDVERPRRAHQNDLENIPVFFMIALAYVLTDPSPWLAINLFRAYTVARIAHTFVYAVVVIPQPARGLSWAVGYGVTWFMGLMCIKAFY
ncbi:unnamed protein product [Nesidiocoris tenuis]|uniref:Microsomal glutathione S-transferase 1 n=2 Tax=Nesidiocoris tenuis TaxID=355587 RepID=A0A6H5G0F1_9HEMI|nr:Microsomal glutathione [Nesidiocoris tenuis]CAA9995469.1 unnamed protein product [Nesidiocoris tenuis]